MPMTAFEILFLLWCLLLSFVSDPAMLVIRSFCFSYRLTSCQEPWYIGSIGDNSNVDNLDILIFELAAEDFEPAVTRRMDGSHRFSRREGTSFFAVLDLTGSIEKVLKGPVPKPQTLW